MHEGEGCLSCHAYDRTGAGRVGACRSCADRGGVPFRRWGEVAGAGGGAGGDGRHVLWNRCGGTVGLLCTVLNSLRDLRSEPMDCQDPGLYQCTSARPPRPAWADMPQVSMPSLTAMRRMVPREQESKAAGPIRGRERRPHDAGTVAPQAPRNRRVPGASQPGSGRGAGLPHVQMAGPGEVRRLGRKDPAELVAGLLRDPARGRIVHLVEQVDALQAVGREGLEGPAGDRLQSPGATPRPRACAAVQ